MVCLESQKAGFLDKEGPSVCAFGLPQFEASFNGRGAH